MYLLDVRKCFYQIIAFIFVLFQKVFRRSAKKKKSEYEIIFLLARRSYDIVYKTAFSGRKTFPLDFNRQLKLSTNVCFCRIFLFFFFWFLFFVGKFKTTLENLLRLLFLLLEEKSDKSRNGKLFLKLFDVSGISWSHYDYVSF